VCGWLPRRDHSGTKSELLAHRFGLRDLQQCALVVLEASRPGSFLRRRRYAVDLDGALRFCSLDAKLSRSGIDARSRAMPFPVRSTAFNRRNLRRLTLLSLLCLSEPDPLGDLLVPLQGREVGPMLELALLADAHAADVLDAIGVDEAAPLNVADFLDVDRRRGTVDRLARIIAVVGRGDSAAGHDAAESAERNGPADTDAIAGLSRWQGIAEDESGQGGHAASPQVRGTHRRPRERKRPRAQRRAGPRTTGSPRFGADRRPGFRV